MGRRETKKRMGDLFNDVMLEDSADLIAGVDEAGRGPLAGPVVAAAVILDPMRPIGRWPTLRLKRLTNSTFCRPQCLQ